MKRRDLLKAPAAVVAVGAVSSPQTSAAGNSHDLCPEAQAFLDARQRLAVVDYDEDLHMARMEAADRLWETAVPTWRDLSIKLQAWAEDICENGAIAPNNGQPYYAALQSIVCDAERLAGEVQS